MGTITEVIQSNLEKVGFSQEALDAVTVTEEAPGLTRITVKLHHSLDDEYPQLLQDVEDSLAWIRTGAGYTVSRWAPGENSTMNIFIAKIFERIDVRP